MSKRPFTSQEPNKRIKDYIPTPPKNPNTIKDANVKMLTKLTKQSKNKDVLAINDSLNKNVLLELDSDRTKVPSKEKGGGGKFICYCSSQEVTTQKAISTQKEKICSFLIKKTRKRASVSSLEEIRSLDKNNMSHSCKSNLLQKEYNIIIPGKGQRKCASVQKMTVLTDYESNQFRFDEEKNESRTKVQYSNSITVKKAKDLRQSIGHSIYYKNDSNADPNVNMNASVNTNMLIDKNNNKQLTSNSDIAEFDIPTHHASIRSPSYKNIPTAVAKKTKGDNCSPYNYNYNYIDKKKDQGGKVDFNKILDYSPYKKNVLLKKIILIQTEWQKHSFRLVQIQKIIFLQSYWRRYWLRLRVYKYITTYYRLRTFISHIRKVSFFKRKLYEKDLMVKLKNCLSLKDKNQSTAKHRSIARNCNTTKALNNPSRRLSNQNSNNSNCFSRNTLTNSNKLRLSETNTNPIPKPIISEPVKSFSLFSHGTMLQITNTHFQIKGAINPLVRTKVQSYIIDNNSSQLSFEDNMSIKAYYYEEMYNKLIKEIEELHMKFNKRNINESMKKNKGIQCSFTQSLSKIDIDTENKIRLTYKRIERKLMYDICYNDNHMILSQFTQNKTEKDVNNYTTKHIDEFHISSLKPKVDVKAIEGFDIILLSSKDFNTFSDSKLMITNSNSVNNNNNDSFCINTRIIRPRKFQLELFGIENLDLPLIKLNKQDWINQIDKGDQFCLLNQFNLRRSMIIDSYTSHSFAVNYLSQYTKQELINEAIGTLNRRRISDLIVSKTNPIDYINEVNKAIGFRVNNIQVDNSLFPFSIINNIEIGCIYQTEHNCNIQLLSSIEKKHIVSAQESIVDSFAIDYHSKYTKEKMTNDIIGSLYQTKISTLTQSNLMPIEYIHNSNGFNTNRIQLDNTILSFSIIDHKTGSLLIKEPNFIVQFISSSNSYPSYASLLQTISVLSFTLFGNSNLYIYSLSSLPLEPKAFAGLTLQTVKSLSFVACCPRRIVVKERIVKSRANTNSSVLGEEGELLNNSCAIRLDRDISLCNSYQTTPGRNSQFTAKANKISTDSVYSSNSRQSVAYRQTKFKFIIQINKAKHKLELCKAFMKWHKDAVIKFVKPKKESDIDEHYDKAKEINETDKPIYMRRGMSCLIINTIVYKAILRKQFSYWKHGVLTLRSTIKKEKFYHCLVMPIVKKEKENGNASKQKYFFKWFNHALVNGLGNQMQSDIKLSQIPHRHLHIRNNLNKTKSSEEDIMYYYSFYNEELELKAEGKSMIDLDISKISQDISTNLITSKNNNGKDNDSEISQEDITIPTRNHLRLKRTNKPNETYKSNSNLRRSDKITKQKKMKIIKRYINSTNSGSNTVSYSKTESRDANCVNLISSNAILSIITKTDIKQSQIALKKYFSKWHSSNEDNYNIYSDSLPLSRNSKTPSQLKKIMNQIKARKAIIQAIVSLSRGFSTWKKLASHAVIE